MDFPDGFVADLQDLRDWPLLTHSVWRSPQLVRVTYGRLWELVEEVLPTASARLLDVGSGSGTLSLEMARRGHDVVGIEPADDAIELARRVADRGMPGRLTYHQAEVESWDPDGADFDVVITSRVLHHVADPRVALSRMRDWLRPGGQVVVVDFLYDRFDLRAATWMAQQRSLLEAAGRFGDGVDPLPPDPETAIKRIESDWEREYVVEEALNPAATILDPMYELFERRSETWHPHLYWDLLVDLHAGAPDAERVLAERIADWEQALVVAGELPALLVRFAGTRV